ncbi:lipoprotein [Orbaceae bacterium ESL0727]|nr:lipoprotein [Orbaceae bacterium ESL0727]
MRLSLNIKKYLKLGLAILLALTLSACGLKGPLYHPSQQSQQPTDNSTTNANFH